ncbi:hypothetical protein OsI_04139 [Oryza sativa Indica Group]|uniref:Uncharacterized protein n=1 Tax=Oryza sativa subsp. indica TaxID=39946 RepID=B8ABC0_ORYSI|nr:hypothetical protein OsI_04139 [Oryza sativa Indica Group]
MHQMNPKIRSSEGSKLKIEPAIRTNCRNLAQINIPGRRRDSDSRSRISTNAAATSTATGREPLLRHAAIWKQAKRSENQRLHPLCRKILRPYPVKSGDGAGGEEEAVAHEPRRSAQLDDGTIFRPVERPPPPPPWKTLPLLARFYFGSAHESLHCGARFPVSESEARENRKTQDALRSSAAAAGALTSRGSRHEPPELNPCRRTGAGGRLEAAAASFYRPHCFCSLLLGSSLSKHRQVYMENNGCTHAYKGIEMIKEMGLHDTNYSRSS